MPTIVFEGLEGEADLVAEEPDGGRLVDICDDTNAPVPFSCRGVTCGTCRVRVLEGADLLSAPTEEERELLELFEAPEGCRVACVVRVRAGRGVLRLRSLLARDRSE